MEWETVWRRRVEQAQAWSEAAKFYSNSRTSGRRPFGIILWIIQISGVSIADPVCRSRRSLTSVAHDLFSFRLVSSVTRLRNSC